MGGLSTGEAIALVPYADLFNHNPFANSYIDARQTGFFTKTDEVVVYADRSYKKMEQVRHHDAQARRVVPGNTSGACRDVGP